jgi:hypothetical protein
VVRNGKNIKGRALALVVAIIGKRVLGKELGKTIKAIEARNDAGPEPEGRDHLTRRDRRADEFPRRRRSLLYPRASGPTMDPARAGAVQPTERK